MQIYKNFLTSIFAIATLFAVMPAMAAPSKISGQIRDNNNETLPGASVRVDGTTQGVTTDSDGKFSITPNEGAKTITISYMGFTSQTYDIDNVPAQIVLQEDSTSMKEVSVTACSGETLKKLNATKADFNKEKDECVPTECNESYKLENGACVAKEEPKENKDEPAPEQPAEPEAKKESQKTKSSEPEKKSEQPKLSEADSKAKVDALRDNAQNMKDKEKSFENRMLGAAAIGATGIGGMNLMSGMAEQSADDSAEEDMKAYLATFVCDYGQGRNIKGGETNVELPGGNDLFAQVNEYKKLAADLKVRKEALGKQPGIEAEVIYDIAETGLYNNVSIGRQSGAYTSLSKALTDENSADAAAWAKQKSDTASKIKTGAITAGIGAIGGAIGNMVINSKNKNQSDKIINDFEKKKQIVREIQKKADAVPQEKTCKTAWPETTGGTYPDNCTCPANKFFNKEEGCVECTDGKVLNSDKSGCTCPSGQSENTDNGKCETPKPGCTLTGDFTDLVNCKCTGESTQSGNTCTCTAPNYKNADGECVTCPDTHTLNNGVCTKKEEPAPAPASDQPETPAPAQKTTVKIPADTFFDNGKATLTVQGQQFFDKIDDHIKDSIKKATNTDPTDDDVAEYKNYYTCVTGHTDWAKFKGESNKYEKNQKLSEDRANSVKEALTKAGFSNITTKGKGPWDCPSTPKKNKDCRKVDISIQAQPCDN